MRPQAILLLVTVWFAPGFAACAGDAKHGANDVFGDALPPSALTRFGSVRFRHGEPIKFVAYPPNGKTLITATKGATLLIWDRETGKLIRRLTPPPLDAPDTNTEPHRMTRAAMSSDGKLLAVIVPNDRVQLWEVETGKTVRQFKGPKNAGPVCFSPDGKMLGVGSAFLTHLYETETGNELRQFDCNNRGDYPSAIAFSPDSKIIAVPDSGGSKTITLFETATGKKVRQIDLITSNVNCFAFSPDGKWFAYNGGFLVHVSEANTGKEIRTFNSDCGAFSMAFSPDSRSLVMRGGDGAFRLFDATTGNIVQTFLEATTKRRMFDGNVHFNISNEIAFSPEGKSVVFADGLIPRFYDIRSGNERPIPAGGHRGAVSNLALTPDGKTLLSRGADNAIRSWNAATGVETQQFAERSDTAGTALSPDAKLVALGTTEGVIYLIDVATNSEKWQIKGHKGGIYSLMFSTDGKKLASRGTFDGALRICDVANGAELRKISYLPLGPNIRDGFMEGMYEHTPSAQLLRFSPDDRSVVLHLAPSQRLNRAEKKPHSLQFWDVLSGKLIRQIELSTGRVIKSLVYSPDGRLLLTENTDKTVSVWEMASGRERFRLGEGVSTENIRTFIDRPNVSYGPGAQVGSAIAISPDGSLIASQGPNHTIAVWDTTLGKQVGVFDSQNGTITSLLFGCDGKVLISGSSDTTIVAWDLTRLKGEPRPLAELQPKELDTLWSDLLSDNAVTAGAAIRSLVLSSKSAVNLMKTRVRPAANAETKLIDQWLRDLDSNNFAKRSLAMSELEKVGTSALPAMEHVLSTQISLEMRRRIQPLFDKLKSGGWSAEQIRIVRAIETLEKIGTPEAKRLVESLANGASGSLTTHQARSALDRLTLPRR